MPLSSFISSANIEVRPKYIGTHLISLHAVEKADTRSSPYCILTPIPAGFGSTLRMSLDRRVLHVVSPERTFTGMGAHSFHPSRWYDGTAEEAARFYAQTFPDSAVTAVHRAPCDYPDGKEGLVLTVEFTVLGVACLGLNGGPAFRHSEAFSFQIVTEDQAETDRYWNAIVGNGGAESACGWCQDKWGLCWQITPRVLLEATTDSDRAAAKRAFEAMMKMKKIDIATIEAARRGPARP